jgi:cystathionine beta-lyase/cystathionine gamma-synthase
LSFATQAVHAGERAARPDFTPTVTPIYQSVSYGYDHMATLDAVIYKERPGFIYSRHGTPTHVALETALATLEGADVAIACASGMAAVNLALLAAGASATGAVLCAYDIYGNTFALVKGVFPTLGIKTGFVDLITDLSALEIALDEVRPAVVICETMSNPLLRVTDVPAIAGTVHAAGAKLVVDNTFTTPYLFRPLEHGADYVVHSTTKYIGGHGDVLGGVVMTFEENFESMFELHAKLGGALGSTEAWLTLRGLKTLPLRLEKHCQNAMKIAAWLEGHPRVAHVNYPGLASHPQHALARRLYRAGCYGGMISFDIVGGNADKVYHFMEALKLCLPVVSLGDIYTLVTYPPRTTHHRLSEEELAESGIGPGLVRISVGIEEADDLIADLEQALAQI